MKKTTLLNSNISSVISKMGHTDMICVGDCGLPIPDGVERIDLAVIKGVPDFMTVLKAVLAEQCIEKVIMAEEIKEVSPEIHEEILALLLDVAAADEKEIELAYVPHTKFKKTTQKCKAVVRTGETIPYANIILVSSVTF